MRYNKSITKIKIREQITVHHKLIIITVDQNERLTKHRKICTKFAIAIFARKQNQNKNKLARMLWPVLENEPSPSTLNITASWSQGGAREGPVNKNLRGRSIVSRGGHHTKMRTLTLTVGAVCEVTISCYLKKKVFIYFC